MQPQTKPKTSVLWGLPVIVWTGSLSVLVAGFRGDTALIAVGFILVATSILVTLITYGAGTAVMIIPLVPMAAPPVQIAASDQAEFFPKGAISFFIALIAFFAAAWLALYVLMIHHGPNV